VGVLCLCAVALVVGLVKCSSLAGCFSKYVGRRDGPKVTASMYSVDLSELRWRWHAPHMASTFIPVQRDEATDAFLAAAASEGESAARLDSMREQRRQYVRAQRRGMSRTDASAQYLNRTMLVATSEQFRALLMRGGGGDRAKSLLDIGAGRGSVTASLAQALRLNVSQVTTMESSLPIRQELRQAGYQTVKGFDELNSSFGAVALLNVLDRCDDPRTLLRAAAKAMDPRGVMLVATVLPYCDKVHEGIPGQIDAHRPPTKPLALRASLRCGAIHPQSFEANVAAFITEAKFLESQLRLYVCE
jgi:2-polyprenyl-3-methyl-5-hydroxy-6-metoxy-1,4-benzoquinol methylase